MVAWGFWTVFSLSFFSLFEFSQGFLKDLFPLIHCCWMPFTVGCPSFYSVILGFLGYHGFPLFVPLDTRTNVMSATLVTGPFLILHYFPLLRFPLQKPLIDFPVLGELTFDLYFSKASRFHIFRPTFWLLSLLSFFPNGLIPFYQAKKSPTTFLHGPSS